MELALAMSVPTILIIEDHVPDVVTLRHALDRQGVAYLLEMLPDGEAALAFVHQHRTGQRDHVPCVILLDLYLPKFDGIAILEAIRQAPVLHHIHVVVLTSIATPVQHAQIHAHGALCRIKPTGMEGYYMLAAEIIELCTGGTSARKPSKTLI